MNPVKRIKMVKAMDYVARNINDVDVVEEWQVGGVESGDIKFGDLDVGVGDADYLMEYIEDEKFRLIMREFIYVIWRAANTGGLYCDDVCSKDI